MSEHVIELDNKRIILIGTAHISKQSAEEVKEVVEREKPDSVCIELCDNRYQSIVDRNKWQDMDVIKIIKEKKATLLLANLMMSSYQKRMAKQFGINPGLEMIQGINSAKEYDAKLVLADRSLQITFMRLWRGMGLWGKLKLFFQLVLSLLSDEEISEEELEKMKTQDMLTVALSELSSSFPELKTILIDERDKYLAQKIKEAPGEKVIAVVGAGHVPGIMEEIHRENDLSRLNEIPAGSNYDKIIGWGIPLIIVGIVISTFSVNRASGIDQIISWILWNGSLAALGTLLALGHPISIFLAFIAAPISSLNPLLAAGWFAGLGEAFIRRPSVKDFENLSEDINTLKGFWRNKVTHILLVVALANIGSVIGTVVGGADVIRLFIKTMWG